MLSFFILNLTRVKEPDLGLSSTLRSSRGCNSTFFRRTAQSDKLFLYAWTVTAPHEIPGGKHVRLCKEWVKTIQVRMSLPTTVAGRPQQSWADDILLFNKEILTVFIWNGIYGILLCLLLQFPQKVMQIIKGKQKCHAYLGDCYQAVINGNSNKWRKNPHRRLEREKNVMGSWHCCVWMFRSGAIKD